MSNSLAIHGGEPVRTKPFPSWPVHDIGDEEAVSAVVRSGAWGSTVGHRVADFEASFSTFGAVANCVCLCNGTVALDVGLRALEVQPGDEVIVPAYTFIATVAAVLYVGAIPVFADVLPDTHLIDPAGIEGLITDRTKAVIAVHIAGRPCDMDGIGEVVDRFGIGLIEDAAQAHGARWRDGGVGSFGALGTFSFQSSKNLTAGEGGAILTRDSMIADRVYGLVNVGRIRGGAWYDHHTVGYNLRMTEFQAVLLERQLERWPDQQRRRESCAATLDDALASITGVEVAPADARITSHGRHLYLFRIPGADASGARDAIVAALRAEGIPASSGYTNLAKHAAILERAHVNAKAAGRPWGAPTCPVAAAIADTTIWLPQFVLLGGSEAATDVATAVDKVLGSIDQLPAA